MNLVFSNLAVLVPVVLQQKDDDTISTGGVSYYDDTYILHTRIHMIYDTAKHYRIYTSSQQII